MASRAVVLWGNPTTRLWQVMCGGRPASMEKATVQGYVGDTVDISVNFHRMLETMDGIDFLAYTPRGGAGITLPRAQHRDMLGHAIAIVTIACPKMLRCCPGGRAMPAPPRGVYARTSMRPIVSSMRWTSTEMPTVSRTYPWTAAFSMDARRTPRTSPATTGSWGYPIIPRHGWP